MKLKKEVNSEDIKLWHLYIEYLGYKSLTTLKNLSSKIDFKAIILSKLYKNYQKRDQIYQS